MLVTRELKGVRTWYSPAFLRLTARGLFNSDFRPKWNSTTDDMPTLCGETERLKICTRVRLACVPCKWAAILGLGVVGEVVLEVVVPKGITTCLRIVVQGEEVNRST